MPAEPTLAEVLRGAIEGRLADVMTATVGKVMTYDPLRQTIDVQPVIKRPYNIGGGEVDHEELPVLPNVPVLFPRGGGFFFTFPLRPGDHVLLVFTHDSIAMWREKGELTEPGDLRRHSLANAVAIAGIGPEADPLVDGVAGVSVTEGVLGGGVYRVGTAAAVPVALAPIVQAFIDLFNEHTHPTGVGPSDKPAVSFSLSPAATKLKAE